MNGALSVLNRLSVCPSVCMSSVTLVYPAKDVGRNEMPFGSDTQVVPSNIVVDRSPGSPQKRDLGVKILSLQRCRLLVNYFGFCLLGRPER